METEGQIAKRKRKYYLKIGAKVALAILLLDIVRSLVAVYQIRLLLMSPIIPESAIWDDSKPFIFHALVFAITCLAGLLLYYFGKYLLVIIIVALMLLAEGVI